MKLSETAIAALKNGTKLKKRLAFEIDVHVTTIERWIESNDDNGDLTKLRALEVISEETGLTQDQIISEEEHA